MNIKRHKNTGQRHYKKTKTHTRSCTQIHTRCEAGWRRHLDSNVVNKDRIITVVLNGAIPRVTPKHPAGVQGRSESCTSALSLQQHTRPLTACLLLNLSHTPIRYTYKHKQLHLNTVITAARTVSLDSHTHNHLQHIIQTAALKETAHPKM